MEKLFNKLDIKNVINANGKMSIIGVSTSSSKVKNDVNYALGNFFEMSDLERKLGRECGVFLDYEDATFVNSAASGVVLACCGIKNKGNYKGILNFKENTAKIGIMKGHCINFGGSIELGIEISGCELETCGYANACKSEDLESMLNAGNIDAFLYVKSHHCVQKNHISPREAYKLCQEYQIPMIVDIAAEEDISAYSNQCDLAILSGAKYYAAPTSGLVLGKNKYVDWVRQEAKGIGRFMKVGKESIIGLSSAILNHNGISGITSKENLEALAKELNTINGIECGIKKDSSGREIYRLNFKVSPELYQMDAHQLNTKLNQNNPAIYVRDYEQNNGILELDTRDCTVSELKYIIEVIRKWSQNGENIIL